MQISVIVRLFRMKIVVDDVVDADCHNQATFCRIDLNFVPLGGSLSSMRR